MQRYKDGQGKEMENSDLIRSWTTTLEKLRQENILLKNRLSVAVQQQESRTFLEEAESFQQRFVDKDQVIDLLRHDISILAWKNRQLVFAGIDKPLLLLARDIATLVAEFDQMREAFHRCLAEYTVD